jgi:stage III sporulation protein AA
MTHRLEPLLARHMPDSVRTALAHLTVDEWSTLEEIRARAERPMTLYGHDWQAWLGPDGATPCPGEGLILSQADLETWVERLADRSLHEREEELREGYLTLPGGHRVGLAGRAVLTEGRVTTTRDWVGINLRVARAVDGAARPILDQLDQLQGTHPAPSVLLLAPPRGGKTTVLRDLVRLVSLRGFRVGVIDERREIGNGGLPQGFDLGPHTDVLDAWPKAAGIEAAVRSLGLDVVATDEIGDADDARALRLARRSGVSVMATAHARHWEDAVRHPALARILRQRVFDWVVELDREPHPGRVIRVRRAE